MLDYHELQSKNVPWMRERLKLHFNKASPILYDKGTCWRCLVGLGRLPAR